LFPAHLGGNAVTAKWWFVALSFHSL